MVSERNGNMGRFSVEVEISNPFDLRLAATGQLPADQVRRCSMRGVVDTGATRLVLPERVAQELGLEEVGETGVRYADGRVAQRKMAGPVQLAYMGRRGVFTALIEPERESPLIGAIVLEDLDLIADCTQQTLRPRDPNQIISEVE